MASVHDAAAVEVGLAQAKKGRGVSATLALVGEGISSLMALTRHQIQTQYNVRFSVTQHSKVSFSVCISICIDTCISSLLTFLPPGCLSGCSSRAHDTS